MSMPIEFATVEEAAEEFRQGRQIVVVDDEDRENEGDLVVAAEKTTPAAINFMAKHGRGLICLALTEERCDELNLPLMSPVNTSNFGTLTEVTGTANKLTIQTQPSSAATAGVAFAQQPVVRIADQFGNVVTSDNTTVVTAARNAGAGTLQGTTTATAVNGIVTFSNLFHTVANTITINFTATGLTTATSGNVVVSPAAASKLTIQTQPSATATVTAPFAQQPVIRVEDQFGRNTAIGATQYRNARMLRLGQRFPLTEEIALRNLAYDKAMIARRQIIPGLIGRG